jgi:hypothetical protein
MKTLEPPRTGKVGTQVYYGSPFGQCCHTHFIPSNPRTPAQQKVRQILAASVRDWCLKLTELQRQLWDTAAQQAPSHPSLRQYGALVGEQLWIKIDTTLRFIGQASVLEPPAPVVFAPTPVTGLVIDYDAQGEVRLRLNAGPVSEAIMVFGQAPCSPGRMKHRRVVYLGLLGPATDDQCDITALYTARFGPPAPGQKVFIVTSQVKNGWRGQDSVFSAIVPPRPLLGEQQRNDETKVEASAAPVAPKGSSAPAKLLSSSPRAVYKGGTPDAHRLHRGLTGEHPLSIPGTSLVHTVRRALARLGLSGLQGVRA